MMVSEVYDRVRFVTGVQFRVVHINVVTRKAHETSLFGNCAYDPSITIYRAASGCNNTHAIRWFQRGACALEFVDITQRWRIAQGDSIGAGVFHACTGVDVATINKIVKAHTGIRERCMFAYAHCVPVRAACIAEGIHRCGTPELDMATRAIAAVVIRDLRTLEERKAFYDNIAERILREHCCTT